MKILQVNGYESPGRRFHGLSITPLLKNYGIESTHFAWLKDTQNPKILTFDNFITRKINSVINKIERLLSLQSVFHRNATKIMRMPAFKEADLVHLHIIHSGFFSMAHLPKLSKSKPTVWTLHDPWALTGHCIHPFDCERWKIGCGKCPYLTTPKALLRDNTKLLFNYKKRAYKKSKLNIIVASKWMQRMVEASPMFENVKTHLVLFGLDLKFFSPTAAPYARKLYGIPDNVLVICFRADDNLFKGLPYIIEALKQIKSEQPICLLNLGDSQGKLDMFRNKFQLINLGWINDEELIRDALIASDIFLMPSIAESFGVMAVEAMACGKPTIVFDGTSLPEITFAPKVGISVPMRDAQALYLAIQDLIDNPDKRKSRGQKGREVAELHYDEKIMAQRLSEIYHEVGAQ